MAEANKHAEIRWVGDSDPGAFAQKMNQKLVDGFEQIGSLSESDKGYLIRMGKKIIEEEKAASD